MNSYEYINSKFMLLNTYNYFSDTINENIKYLEY